MDKHISMFYIVSLFKVVFFQNSQMLGDYSFENDDTMTLQIKRGYKLYITPAHC